MLRIDEIPNVEKSHERKEISKDIETPTNELADCIQLQSNEFEKVCVLPSSHSDPQQLNENVAPKEELINSRVRKCAQDNSLYYCNQCQKQFRHNSGLSRHKKEIHEGFKYLCFQCNYRTSQKSTLEKHIQSIHKGVKYPCDQCSYKATQKCSLQRHIHSAHDGVK